MDDLGALGRVALIVLASIVGACATPIPTTPVEQGPPASEVTGDPPASGPPSPTSRAWTELTSNSFIANDLEVLGVAARLDGGFILGSQDDFAGLWESTDLTSWGYFQLPGAEPGSRAKLAAASPEVEVVVGTGRRTQVVMWRRSADGVWRAVPLEATTVPKGSTVRSLTWTGTMFIAVGSVAHRSSEELTDNEVAAWSSGDGVAWERLQLPSPPNRGGWLTDVAASEGKIVAGGTLDGGRSTEFVVFVSPDGQSWALANPPRTPSGGDEYIASVGASPAAYLLTSRLVDRACREADCISGQGLTWLSTDGASWELTAAESMPPAVFGATGNDFVSMAYSDPAFTVLSTADGSTYQEIGDPFTPPDRIIVSGWALTDQGVLIAGVAPMDPTRVFAWKQS